MSAQGDHSSQPEFWTIWEVKQENKDQGKKITFILEMLNWRL